MKDATLKSKIFRRSPGGGFRAEDIYEVHGIVKCQGT